MAALSRRWIFTLNNPEAVLDTSDWATRGVTAAVWQRERGEAGTEHFQGYIKFGAPHRMKYIKDTLKTDRIHVEAAKGTHEQCIDYCTKMASHIEGPWWFPNEAAVRTATQGKASQLCDMAAALVDGKNMSEVADIDPATYIRNYRGLASYALLKLPAETRAFVRSMTI